MAARKNQNANAMAFESYFAMADANRDGRIDGDEALAFFQGTNLPKPVLAKIWAHADQRQAGFLGREEFYNALRLVTVAQSGRELTPEIVQAALKSPAASAIPPPKINMSTNPPSQVKLGATPNSSAQIGPMGATAYQNPGFMGQQISPTTALNQQTFLTGNLPQAKPAASIPLQGVGQKLPGASGIAGPQLSDSNALNLSTDWFNDRASVASVQRTPQVPVTGIAPPMGQNGFGPSLTVSPQIQTSASSAASVPQMKDATLSSSSPDTNASVLGGISGSQHSNTHGVGDPPQKMSLVPSSGSQLQQIQSLVNQTQLSVTRSSSVLPVFSVSVRCDDSLSDQSQSPWPEFTHALVHHYTSIFLKVDRDRDGKITGQESHNLFLSWGLPIEVLKQVWDLSDQDNDSMLSLREFCIALYLMQRYREGCPLPPVLPDSVKLDQTLLHATSQPLSGNNGSVWQKTPGFSGSRPPLPANSAKSSVQAPKAPQVDDTAKPAETKSRVPVLEKNLIDQLSKEEQDALQSKFQEASDVDKKVQELEKEILESKEKTEFYSVKMQELILYKSRCDNRLNEISERAIADKKEVESLAKKYEEKYKQTGDVTSKLTIEEATFRDVQERKLELYNAIIKMEQGSTTDGLLQTRADKIQGDIEELVKILSERCKQYGLSAKPTSLIELPFGWQPGIQGGSADWDENWDKFVDDGFNAIKELTVEVENVASHTQNNSSPVPSKKDLKDEVSQVALPSNVENKAEKYPAAEQSQVALPSNVENKAEKSPAADQSQVALPSNVENKVEKSPAAEQALDNVSVVADSEAGPARRPSSPGRNALDNISKDTHPADSETHDISPLANDDESDNGEAESSLSGDKTADELSWDPTFDHCDDTDSLWGYNPKDDDNRNRRPDFSSGSEDFGLFPINTGSTSVASAVGKEKSPFFDSVPSTPQFNSVFPINTGSPSAASVLVKEKSPFFDSVPSTPQYNSIFSPKFSEEPEGHSFDTFSRDDPFGMNGTGAYSQRDTFGGFHSFGSTTDYKESNFTSFDSMHNTSDYGRGENTFSRFDSMHSTADYGKSDGSFTRFDSIRSTADYGKGDSNFARFDSMRSTADYGKGESSFTRFDSMQNTADYSRGFYHDGEGDLYGSDTFKPSGTHSPKKGTHNWDAF